jgi:threonyl-tRNA synthetase
MVSRKKQADPWWFSPTQFDIIAIAKVYRRLPYLAVQKVLYTLAQAKYPTRPKRAKNDWMESVYVDGATYQLSCRIDENEKKIVVTNIRPPKGMSRTRRHK